MHTFKAKVVLNIMTACSRLLHNKGMRYQQLVQTGFHQLNLILEEQARGKVHFYVLKNETSMDLNTCTI